MSQDDPFSSPDAERTVIIPTPGGRGAMPSGAAASMPAMVDAHDAAPPTGGLNPLVAAANPLLDTVGQLRATLRHPNPAGLRDQLAAGIKTFEARARASGVAPEHINPARYALCTLLDEAAASTPWGGSGQWAKHSLLVMFYNESWGGEKFFQILARLAEDPARYHDLLELYYACLALGFEGRYRVLDNGREQLDLLRERVAHLLRKQSGEYERELSPRWQGVAPKPRSLLASLPIWVGVAVFGLLLLGAYLTFNAFLNDASDPVYADIQAIRVKPPAVREVAAAPVAKPRLAKFLEREIAEGLVSVREDDAQSVVTLRGDGLFPPASSTIEDRYVPVIGRIGDALAAVPGRVLVTGHSDNQPIRSARYPSNWHLSQERALSVRAMLATRVPAARLQAEGRAEGEPIAPNDTPQNRSRNRRVEITLFVAPAGS